MRRQNSIGYKMLLYMYYEKRIRLKDLRNTCRETYTKNISKAIKKLIEDELLEIKEEEVLITKKGEVFVQDKEGINSYEYKFRDIIGEEYKRALNKGQIDKYLETERAKSMFSFAKVGINEKTKPRLPELLEQIDMNEYQDLLLVGLFYTKREIIEWLATIVPQVGDLINTARFNGVFLNKHRICITYVQPYGSDAMFRINYADVIAKQYIEEYLKRAIGMYYGENYEIQSIVFANGESLVWAMATGWTRGHLKEGTKKQLFKNYTKNKDMDNNQALEYNSETGHVTVAATFYPNAVNIEKESEQMEMVKKEIKTSIFTNKSLFSYASGIYQHVYVIPATIKGANQLNLLIQKSNDEIYSYGYKQIYGEEPEQIEITSTNIGEIRDRHYLVMGLDEYPVAYVPFYDVMQLHEISCDGKLAQSDNLMIVTGEDMANAISHSIRREVKYVEIDNPSEEITDVPIYNYDGYVLKGNDPYKDKRKAVDDKSRNYYIESRTTIVTSSKEKKEWQKLAEEKGMSLNAFLKSVIRNQIGIKEEGEKKEKQD